jgi:hypothetical protein
MDDYALTNIVASGSDEKSSRPSFNPSPYSGSAEVAVKSSSKIDQWKLKALVIVNHWAFAVTMAILNLYSLFGEDIRIVAFTKHYDSIFISLTSVCIFFFLSNCF